MASVPTPPPTMNATDPPPSPETTATSTAAPSPALPDPAAPPPEPEKQSFYGRLQDKYGSKARTIVTAALCLLALLVSGRVFAFLSSYKVPPSKKTIAQQVYNVRTFTVQPRDYREIVSGFGTAAADRQVSISAEVAGKIVRTHADLEVGTEVAGPSIDRDDQDVTQRNDGELLFEIDPATYQRRFEQLQRALDADDVELDQLIAEEENTRRLITQQRKTVTTSQEELSSQEALVRRNAGSRSQLRSAQLALQQAEDALVRLQNELSLFEVREAAVKARRSGNEANLETARLDVQRSTVQAPFDGQISMVNVDVGQYVRPGDSLLELTDLDHIEVPVALSQEQFSRVEPLLLAARDGGEYPRVELAENETAEPRWTGRLVRAAPVANTDTRTVSVYVEVDNAEQDQPLLPGTFVHARIEGPVLKDALLVPRDALIRDSVFLTESVPDDFGQNDGSEDGSDAAPAGVEIADIPDDAMLAAGQEIVIERTLQTFAVIESGLKPGDELIITNLDRLVDGRTLVRPQDELTVEQEIDRQRTEAVRLAE